MAPPGPGRSCMLFDGMLALAGAAVVDHARRARRQSKGFGPGLVPVRTRPAVASPAKFLLAHHLVPAVPQASFLCCPMLSWAALCWCCVGVRVPPLLVSALLRRWRCCRGCRWCVVCGGEEGGGGKIAHSEW